MHNGHSGVAASSLPTFLTTNERKFVIIATGNQQALPQGSEQTGNLRQFAYAISASFEERV